MSTNIIRFHTTCLAGSGESSTLNSRGFFQFSHLCLPINGNARSDLDNVISSNMDAYFCTNSIYPKRKRRKNHLR